MSCFSSALTAAGSSFDLGFYHSVCGKEATEACGFRWLCGEEVPCTDLTVTGSIISSWFSGAQVGGRIENGGRGRREREKKKFWLEFPWHKERWGGRTRNRRGLSEQEGLVRRKGRMDMQEHREETNNNQETIWMQLLETSSWLNGCRGIWTELGPDEDLTGKRESYWIRSEIWGNSQALKDGHGVLLSGSHLLSYLI